MLNTSVVFVYRSQNELLLSTCGVFSHSESTILDSRRTEGLTNRRPLCYKMSYRATHLSCACHSNNFSPEVKFSKSPSHSQRVQNSETLFNPIRTLHHQVTKSTTENTQVEVFSAQCYITTWISMRNHGIKVMLLFLKSLSKAISTAINVTLITFPTI
jgi:hypothetical protein